MKDKKNKVTMQYVAKYTNVYKHRTQQVTVILLSSKGNSALK